MGTALNPAKRLLFKTVSSVLQSPLLYQNLAKEVHFMTDCIFCKIIAGDIPAAKVYEDEAVLAFLDISQVTPGHTLVVPKQHFRNLLEMDGNSSSQLFERVPQIARKVMKATGAAGMNIINNNEEIAGQTVFHTHIHLAPRYDENDDLKLTFVAHEPDFSELSRLASEISQAID